MVWAPDALYSIVPEPEVKLNNAEGTGKLPPIFSVPPENMVNVPILLPETERLPAQTSKQLELAKERVALALLEPMSVMLPQAPPVTSTVSVAALIVIASVESGCPPGPEPVVIALQFWLALIVIAAACTEIAPIGSSAAVNNHARVGLFI